MAVLFPAYPELFDTVYITLVKNQPPAEISEEPIILWCFSDNSRVSVNIF